MVILKKIRSATLVETLTASVLVVIVFIMASIILNNTFANTIRKENSAIQNKIHELQYLYQHKKIKIPYVETYGGWELEIIKEQNDVILLYTKENDSQELILEREVTDE